MTKIKVLLLTLSLFTLVGCTINKNDEVSQILKLKESTEEVKVYKDKLKVIYLISDSSAYVFYFKNNVVSDFKLYFETDSEKNASNILNTYKSQFESQEEVENVTSDERFIVIDYKDEYVTETYENATMDEIVGMIEYMNTSEE